MFTFKKFAAVGVAAFAAFTFSSCSDGEGDDEEGGESPSYTVGADEAALGGASNNTYGSSLDIDVKPARVYKISEVTSTVANEIDIIFDGTNVYTPASIQTSTASAVATLKSKYANSTSGAYIFAVPSNIDATVNGGQQLVNAYLDAQDANANDLIITDTSVGKKFGVQSSIGTTLALVTVKQKDTADGGTVLVVLTIVD